MHTRRLTKWLLASLAVVATSALAFVLTRSDSHHTAVVFAAASESQAARVKREALMGMGAGRSLGKPASVTPERVQWVRHAPPRGGPSASAPPSAAPPREAAPTVAGARPLPGNGDGIVSTLEVTTPPFEVTRRYRSMEGPFAEYKVRLDGGAKDAPRELWWWKGARIEMLDEAGAPLDQEFMCHLNVDMDSAFREKVLGKAPHTPRLLTLTQGQMTFVLPTGHGLPVASDETWSLMFQVLNHNRDGAFRVKQRLVLYFVRDVDLFRPIDATEIEAGSLWVTVDRSSPDALRFDAEACHCCAPLGRALEAPNNIAGARRADALGRAFVAHWTVPPGPSTWTYPFKQAAPDFDPRGKRLYAAWTHVHPFATEARLSVITPGCAPTAVFRSKIVSVQDGKTGLVRIEPIASEAGLPLPESGDYEMAVDYDNTSGVAQDSMTSFGLLIGDDGWKRPAWADRAQNQSGMTESCASP